MGDDTRLRSKMSRVVWHRVVWAVGLGLGHGRSTTATGVLEMSRARLGRNDRSTTDTARDSSQPAREGILA